ncbi:MAG: BMP family ABC transporter substrate-binding protein [Evtepia sp.]
MKKRILALLLSCLMMVGLAACGSPTPETPDTDPAATAPKSIPLADLKVGLVLVGETSEPYNANHIEGMNSAIEALKLSKDQVITKANISEDAGCETAIRELVEAGCQIIFTNSFGHEQFLLAVAPDYPQIQFCSATGQKSGTDELANTHNYFAKIHEARYLAGITAGLKTKTNKLGYVAAKNFPEVISGFTAFYLGAKSVNPNVELFVNYTNEWSDAGKESTNAQALIDLGCDVIGQHSDTTAPATTAEANGVWAVGYNADMIPAAPKAALVSARINWGVYYQYALDCVINGKAIDQDWCKGFADNAVFLSPLNETVVAEGTKAAIDQASGLLLDGSLHVFQGPLKDVEGKEVVAADTFYPESEKASAPSWDKIIEGINILS